MMGRFNIITEWLLSNLPTSRMSSYLRYWYYGKQLKYSGGPFWSESGLEIVHPENVSIGKGCTFLKNVVIFCCGTKDNPNKLAKDSYLSIGDNCFIHPNVRIIAGSHNWNIKKTDEFVRADTTIGNRVHIMPNVIIFPGVTIGDDALIGAGSIVTRSIPPRVIAYGSPCKVARIRK